MLIKHHKFTDRFRWWYRVMWVLLENSRYSFMMVSLICWLCVGQRSNWKKKNLNGEGLYVWLRLKISTFNVKIEGGVWNSRVWPIQQWCQFFPLDNHTRYNWVWNFTSKYRDKENLNFEVLILSHTIVESNKLTPRQNNSCYRDPNPSFNFSIRYQINDVVQSKLHMQTLTSVQLLCHARKYRC